MTKAYLALGSNIGNGLENLVKAWRSIGSVHGVKAGQLSSPYLTKPVISSSIRESVPGDLSNRWFTNAVGMIETILTPEALLQEMHKIEADLGRDKKKGRDRTMDLDLLYYDDLIIYSPGIILPHPGIPNRLFVLVPLEELAPELQHPVVLMTSAEMRRQIFDPDQIVIKSAWLHEERLS